MWLLIAVLLPLICLFEPIFVLLQVEPDVAQIAGKYMQYSAFGVPVSEASETNPCGVGLKECYTGFLFVRMHAQILPSARQDDRASYSCSSGSDTYFPSPLIRSIRLVRASCIFDKACCSRLTCPRFSATHQQSPLVSSGILWLSSRLSISIAGSPARLSTIYRRFKPFHKTWA